MGQQPTIAMALIVKGTKDEAPLLDTCLESISGHVDAIYLNLNHAKGKKVAKEVIEVAEKYNATYFITEWTGNFVNARNFIFGKVPKEYDFIGWIDSDDTIDKPEEIRRNIAVLSQQQQGIYVKYDYDHDEYGNVTVSHWVARIVRNNGSYVWKSSIADEDVAVHETLNEVTPRPKAMSEDFKVIHHSDSERREASLIRNIELLEGMHKRQEDNGEYDPRTLFYLATHYYDAGNFRDAAGLLRTYLTLSGWPEERCEAHIYLGNIYQRFDDTEHAYEEYIRALGEYQNSPRSYIELSQLSYNMGRYEDSANWIEKCLQLPKATTTMVQRPMETSYRAYMLAAQAYTNIGGKRLDDAKKYVEKALKLRPLDKDAKAAQEMINGMIDQREDIRAAARLVRTFESEKMTDKIIPFLDTLPMSIQDNPLLLTTRFNYTEPKVWGEKSIAIYVGQGPLGIWGPWSLKDGIGGSEEAVIQMSKQLALMGWKVTVYATPGDKFGYYNTADVRSTNGSINMDSGVGSQTILWKQYYEFNPKDEYNILIGWRNPNFFDYGIKAKKKYLWLHDVMPVEDFTKERLDNIDKVIFVGQYHAELYKGVIPEEKWFVSGNGIDPQDFINADNKFERTPHRMVYMSSYNRGLKILLENWNKIRTEVPDATLDVYYGWQSYDALNSDNPERMAWKRDMVKLMKQPGIKEHGRVGHQQIIEELNKAEILAYPCVFPEVYAITFVKALAAGTPIVASDFAELGNYKDGIKVHYEQGKVQEFTDEYIATLIDALKGNKKFTDTKESSRKQFSWSNTAMGWDKEFAGEK